MSSALQYAGYESDFVIGGEGHNAKHGGAILPDALRWVWKRYPKPVIRPAKVNDRGAHASTDQSLLVVNDPHTRWVWSFQIQDDGSLSDGQPFYRLETADESSETDA